MTLWYLARAAGFAALISATIAVVLGALASSPRAAKAPDQRILRQFAHRSAAVLTLALLTLHVVLLVTDNYVDLSLPGVLLPFTAGYRPWALGLGTLAAYILLVVGLTGLARGRLASSAAAARGWRAVHASAYLMWPLAMAHGLLAGSDTTAWWAWSLYAECAAAVLVAGWIRLGALERPVNARLHAARRQLHSGGVR